MKNSLLDLISTTQMNVILQLYRYILVTSKFQLYDIIIMSHSYKTSNLNKLDPKEGNYSLICMVRKPRAFISNDNRFCFGK